MRRARRRPASVTFYAQTFQKPARYFCHCPTGPSGRAGRGLPTGGRGMSPWSLVVVFWRVVWYLRGRDRINAAPGYRAWPSYPSCLSRLAVMSWPWLWRPWPWPSCLGAASLAAVAVSLLSMDVSPSCGCDTPTNASVYNVFSGVLCLDLRNINVARIVIAIKQTTTERNGDEREATTTKPTAARTVTRSPLGRRGMDD